MANYRRIVAFNMCLHMLVLCSIYSKCTDTFSLLLHATTTCPIQIPACYKKRVLASTKSISNSLFSKILILIILVADFSLWLSILLLYCGDIHPNPGPFSSSNDSFDSSNTQGPSFSSISLNQNLSFVHYNVQSIVIKLDILHAELLDFDILAFTETWLSPAVSTNDLMLQSYNIPERKDRTGDPHGGVIVYVKNGIFYKRREDLEIRGLECLWIEVINPRRRILFGLFYRAPNSDANYYNNIEDSVSLSVDTGIKDIVITGDFNLNYLNNTSRRKIDSLCMQFSLHQSISQPTHFTEHSSSLIDIILVSFIPGDSTENQLTFLYHTFCEALDAGKEVRAVFCDISKAFDRVWHTGLLYKLCAAGVTGNVLQWFKKYLSDRNRGVYCQVFLLLGTLLRQVFLKAQFWALCFF